jgi:uncharacterized Zn-finger protein
MSDVRDPSAPAASAGPAPAVVELEAADLPAFCPNRRMPVWNQHPRVYLDVTHTGHALCPYCSTEYRLKPGTVVRGH